MSATAATAPPAAPAGEGGPPAPPPNLTSNRRLQQTQAQVDEVVDIMRVNVDKVLERDQKLSELDDRADALQAGASQFETSAAKLKRKYWWKNLKMMIILGVICAIILIIIIDGEPEAKRGRDVNQLGGGEDGSRAGLTHCFLSLFLPSPSSSFYFPLHSLLQLLNP
ncbi:vesicle-associated membrane protein 2 isoform X1 [Phocoena sinus]|uniref:vesicle-associated membrane protein 2 isoform X1 n=1 Tax=Phocoena sinus TaxID=42100 RepID=UPI0013C49F1E|nr:vesicle-associated membrane protein 2 isoform X1 [Phocoena sinus]